MPRDYKNRSQATRKEPKKRTGLPPWKSAMGGFVAGLVVAMGAYVEGRYPGTIVAFNAPEFPVPDAVAMADVPPEKTERRKPKFEFYTLLPEVEVEVVEEPEPLRKTKAEKEREQQAQRAAKQIAAQRAEETTSINTLVRVVTPKPAEPLKTKAVKHSVQPEPGEGLHVAGWVVPRAGRCRSLACKADVRWAPSTHPIRGRSRVRALASCSVRPLW